MKGAGKTQQPRQPTDLVVREPFEHALSRSHRAKCVQHAGLASYPAQGARGGKRKDIYI